MCLMILSLVWHVCSLAPGDHVGLFFDKARPQSEIHPISILSSTSTDEASDVMDSKHSNAHERLSRPGHCLTLSTLFPSLRFNYCTYDSLDACFIHIALFYLGEQNCIQAGL